MAFQFERQGLLLVISAPSGGGKSAVLKQLLNEDKSLCYSVSYTSRPPRASEVDGRDFHFVTRERFLELTRQNAFYEHAEVHGNLYGTSASVIEDALNSRCDVAMDVDIQGGLNIKKRRPDAALIFLMPPSMNILERRLRTRASDAEEHIRLRMNNAAREIQHWMQYDYVVVNEVLTRTVDTVKQILHAERQRASRYKMRDVATEPPADSVRAE
jgi:guanylate kinase